MVSVYAERIRTIKQNIGLSIEDLARAVGTTSRTMARWASGANAPRGITRQRLLELATVSQQLAKVMTPEASAAWLLQPNALLGHMRPIDLVAQGRYRDVLDLIDAVGDGVFV